MEKDLGKIKKNADTEIVIRIDDFGGKPGLTIREFVSSDKYTGFTKSGTRIPAESFEAFKKMINSIKPEELKVEDTTQKKLPAKKLDEVDEMDDAGIDEDGLM